VVNFTKDEVKDYFNEIILMVKNLNYSNLLPHSKKVHNLKDIEFEKFKNSKYFF
jgi:hypothetical protein